MTTADSEHTAPRPLPFLTALFLVSAASLTLEVLITRLLSVLTWYSLAFLVIAMGMFGLTAGAVQVYLKAEEYTPERLSASLARDALHFGLLIPVTYILLLVVPLRMEPVATTFFLFLIFAAIIALPFVAAGKVVSAALTKSGLPMGRVYAVDLAGAALGAPLVPMLLNRMNGGTAILAMGVLALMASAAFAAAGDLLQDAKKALIAAVVLCGFTVANGYAHKGLVPLWTKGRAESRANVQFEAWNSHSRIQVSPMKNEPAAVWGAGAKCKVPVVKQRILMIDADAATPLYHTKKSLDELQFLTCDVTNLAHHLRPGGPMAIIGVGGSRDLQAALMFKHKPVVGIELNARLLQMLRKLGKATRVPGNPNVRLVHDEARSYLSRSSERFRIIQASLIDTWAATGAGAHALGENGLYTLEGWKIFLDHLQPDGVVTMSRWTGVETLRLVALATGALLQQGVKNPRDHIILASAGPVTTIVVSKRPFKPADSKRLAEVSAEKGFRMWLAPSRPRGDSPLDKILDAKTMEQLNFVTLVPAFDFRPPTDERPFFFNVVRLSAFTTNLSPQAGRVIAGNRIATLTLVLAFLSSLVLAAIAIVYPLAKKARHAGKPSAELLPALGYFAFIGVGFMLCEMGLLQRLSLVLGHPTYSLMVVLASLIAAAGLGSLISDKLPLDRKPFCYLYPLLLAAAIAGVGFGLPKFAPAMQKAPLFTRIAFSAGLCSGVGLLLGLAFPAGMRIVSKRNLDESPWLWGINGVGGVVASTLAVMVALTFGLQLLFLVSAACYVVLVPLVMLLMRPPAEPAEGKGSSGDSASAEDEAVAAEQDLAQASE